MTAKLEMRPQNQEFNNKNKNLTANSNTTANPQTCQQNQKKT